MQCDQFNVLFNKINILKRKTIIYSCNVVYIKGEYTCDTTGTFILKRYKKNWIKRVRLIMINFT